VSNFIIYLIVSCTRVRHLYLLKIENHSCKVFFGFLLDSSSYSSVLGRVLADDIYRGSRCIAVRNQDIGIGLFNQLKTFQTQPISIRTPFTCRNTSWICRLCYGQSPTQGHLVELGEAVGIMRC